MISGIHLATALSVMLHMEQEGDEMDTKDKIKQSVDELMSLAQEQRSGFWFQSLKDAAQLIVDQQQVIDELVGRIEASNVALNDWLHIYAPDLSGDEYVKASQDRVYAIGTLAYIAEVTSDNRDSISRAKGHTKDAE